MIDRTKWHKWFAWFPVETLGNRWVWLKPIERRWNWDLNWWGDGGSGYSGTDGGWEYKLRRVA